VLIARKLIESDTFCLSLKPFPLEILKNAQIFAGLSRKLQFVLLKSVVRLRYNSHPWNMETAVSKLMERNIGTI